MNIYDHFLWILYIFLWGTNFRGILLKRCYIQTCVKMNSVLKKFVCISFACLNKNTKRANGLAGFCHGISDMLASTSIYIKVLRLKEWGPLVYFLPVVQGGQLLWLLFAFLYTETFQKKKEQIPPSQNRPLLIKQTKTFMPSLKMFTFPRRFSVRLASFSWYKLSCYDRRYFFLISRQLHEFKRHHYEIIPEGQFNFNYCNCYLNI